MSPRPSLTITFCLLCPSAFALGLFEKNHPLVEKGLNSYNQEKYDEALHDFDEAKKELPNSAALELNRGNALYKLGRFDEAQKAYHQASSAPQPDLKEKDYYNLGNAWEKVGNHQEAATAYRKALTLDPKDEQARHNLEVVLRNLKRPPPPQPDGGMPQQDGGSDGGSPDGGRGDGGTGDGGQGDGGTDSQQGRSKGDGGQGDDGGSQQPSEETGGDAGGPPPPENPREDGGLDGGNENEDSFVPDGGTIGERKLNRQEIERLLDSLKQNEKSLQLWKFQQKRARKQHEKDW